MKAILSTLVLVFAFGCSVEREEKKYSYQYNNNGCDTGRQEFKSKDSYCAALLNDALNKGCARSTRERVYANECPDAE